MNDIDNCLRHIAKVKRVARGEDAAYVARSRLGRLALSVAAIVAGTVGLPAPDRPGVLSVPDDANGDVRSLVTLCNRLSDTAKTLVQPSEPLDERWKDGWAALLRDLDLLEQRLRNARERLLTTDSR